LVVSDRLISDQLFSDWLAGTTNTNLQFEIKQRGDRVLSPH